MTEKRDRQINRAEAQTKQAFYKKKIYLRRPSVYFQDHKFTNN